MVRVSRERVDQECRHRRANRRPCHCEWVNLISIFSRSRHVVSNNNYPIMWLYGHLMRSRVADLFVTHATIRIENVIMNIAIH